MEDTVTQTALRETRTTFASPRALAAMAAAVVLLALAGPFGTGDALTFVPRLAYWAFTVPITYATGSLVGTGLLVAVRRSRPYWQAMTTAAIAAGLAITGVVGLLNWLTFGIGPELLPLSAIFLASAIVTGAVITLSRELERETDIRPAPPPLLDRLEFARRGPLVSLSVQDHYVEVVTTRGASLVLMRLSDAIRETGDDTGMQVHRSHWVAFDQVESVTREGDKARITLKDGRDIPAARSYIPALKEAGLLPR